MKSDFIYLESAMTWRKVQTVLAVCLMAACLTQARAGEPFNLKRYLNWEIALCNHPMWMLIDEDRGVPVVGERVPPWGAASADDYVQRVRRILAALDKDPEAKVNFEWSLCEFEDMARRYPDVLRHIREACQRGQMDFVDGAYSQAHMSTFGSESNWRQFEYGLEGYQRLLGKKIVVYASQEDQLAPQIPQILRHFGYKYMVMPLFPWRVTLTKGPFDLLGAPGYYLWKGCEFLNATALDGSSLPAYMAVEGTDTDTAQMRDLWGASPLSIAFPDMEEYRNPLGKWAKPVLLEQALDERIKIAPPVAEGRVSTFESYAEGVWAEEHLRANRLAEQSAVLAGDLLAMSKLAALPDDDAQQSKLRGIWEAILKYEHHDVTWIEVTDLRRKGIQRFQACAAESDKLMADVAAQLAPRSEGSVAIFNGLSHPRSVLLDVAANQIPGGSGKFQKFGGHYLGFRAVPAGGFKSFPLAPGGWIESKQQPMPERIAADDYTVELSKEGLMNQIVTGKGAKLLVPGSYLGGEIRAVIDGQWADNRTANCRFYDGDVCATLERSGLFGVTAPEQAAAPAAIWTTQGKIGGAIELRGDSYLSAGSFGRHNQLTVAMWIKPTALREPLAALLHTDGWDTSGFHFILRDDGRIQLAVNGAEPVDPMDMYSTAPAIKTLGQWVHLAAVYDGDNKRIKLYINGKKGGEAALKESVPVKLGAFRVGAWDREPRPFEGAIDDVRIYASALDDAEIQKVTAGAADSDNSLLAWWKLDETSGELAADSSGHGHPATVEGGEPIVNQSRVPLTERYYFFKHQPVIKVELDFDFNGNEIGDFHLEETKLNVYYPTRGGEIYHDIPFGYLSATENEQLFATTWLYCGGLVYANCGTIKHWVRDGVMANTIAWGGRRFSNRVQWSWTNTRQYDLRLYGQQKIVYYLIPFGPFDGPAVTRAVEDVLSPVFLAPGNGEKSFYGIGDKGLAVTSLFEKDGQVSVRGYQIPSGSKQPFHDWTIFNVPLKEVQQ